MDHIPYPVSTSVPRVEVPLLVLDAVRGSDSRLAALGKAEEPRGTLTQDDCTRTRDHSAIPAPELDHASPTDWTLDFWEYPQKRGWTFAGSFTWWTQDVEETARRAQEWMYFELLQRFLRQPIDVSSLARKDEKSETVFLDSSSVPELIIQWSQNQQPSQQDQQNHNGTKSEEHGIDSHVLSLLAQVMLECSRLDDLPGPAQSTGLAIRVLVETLTHAIYSLAQVGATEIQGIQKLESNALLKQRFLENGWCPFQIARLWGHFSASTTYYISSLLREPTFGGVRHDRCDDLRCMTTSIDPATYEHRHAESCSVESSTCQMVGVQSSAVADCIKSGHIPLIRFDEGVDGVLRPTITKSHNDLRYVALSHVWSGGLGNVSANSMFSCQLRKLHRLLQTIRENGDDDLDRDRGPRKTRGMKRDLRASLGMKPLPEEPMLLWIDTLCVPVSAEHAQTRQMAITQMAQIYVQAQCVLVVDPELQHMKHKDLPDEEVFASVQCSSWNSRSWTFQEAAMARVFYVQFLDGYSIIDKKWHDFMKKTKQATASDTTTLQLDKFNVDMCKTITTDVSRWFETMPVMTKIRSYDARTLMTRSEDWQNFVRVWNGLRTRSTTKSDDLYGIIAIMVDLTAHEILRLDPRERMKAILRSQSTLPLSLLYQDCPRILDPKGQSMWAPSQIAGGYLDMSCGYMSLHDDGLYVELQKESKEEGFTCFSRPQIYGFSCQQQLPSSFALCPNHHHVRTLSVRLCLGGKVETTDQTGPWLILFNEPSGRRNIAQALPGALLRRTGSDGLTVIATYTCPVEITIADEMQSVRRGQTFNHSESVEPNSIAQSVWLEAHMVRIET
ncbi:MAG: hypothetical protein Q9169_007840, partial [Polycauliona sp. 2 TL-2023]